MNDSDIQEFIQAFDDFMKHVEVEFLYHDAQQAYYDHEMRKQESKMILENEIEKKAAELEITVDYYMEEFM